MNTVSVPTACDKGPACQPWVVQECVFKKCCKKWKKGKRCKKCPDA